MIEIQRVSKTFEQTEAVKDVSLSIQPQNIFGMLGTNGAGKSTLLRMMAGVLKPDAGEILIDGKPVWDNPDVKRKCFYISDEQYFFPNGTADDMMRFYRRYYPKFNSRKFGELMARFGLQTERRIQTYSKGMKKQLSMLLGLCSNASYLFCDETFDGLDPVMRQGMKSLFAKELDERAVTLVIASHNLRELEDICDYIGLLHAGGVVLSKDMEEAKEKMHKIQCVFREEIPDMLCGAMEVLQFNQKGRLVTMTVRGDKDNILAEIGKNDPVYLEALPLSLEEIFICETEVVGYDIKKLIF